MALSKKQQELLEKYPHYYKDVSHLQVLDIYRVLDLWGVTDPTVQHAVKKLVVGGRRGVKNVHKDIGEAVDTLARGLEMRNEDELRYMEDAPVAQSAPPGLGCQFPGCNRLAMDSFSICYEHIGTAPRAVVVSNKNYPAQEPALTAPAPLPPVLAPDQYKPWEAAPIPQMPEMPPPAMECPKAMQVPLTTEERWESTAVAPTTDLAEAAHDGTPPAAASGPVAPTGPIRVN